MEVSLVRDISRSCGLFARRALVSVRDGRSGNWSIEIRDSDKETRVGWTAGAGVENAFWQNWSAKLEYLYVDLGTHSIDTVDVDGAPFHVEHKVRNHILRLGVNYKFN